MTNMLYTVVINQVKALEWGLNSNQAFVFSVIHQLPTWADATELDGKVWYHLSKNKLCDELPLVTNKPDTAWRHMKALADKGLIELTSLGHKTLVRVTAKGALWNRTESEKLGEKSEPRKNIRPSEENPNHGKISDHDEETENTEVAEAFEEETDDLGKISEPRKNIRTSEINSPDLGKISDLTSEKFPTNEYTSNTKYQDKSKTLCAIDSDEPKAPLEKTAQNSQPVNSKPDSVDQLESPSVETSTTDNPETDQSPCTPPHQEQDTYLTASGKRLGGENLANFNQFWDIFGYKKDRARAADAWLKIRWAKRTEPKAIELNQNLLAAIFAAAAIERSIRQLKIENNQTPCFAEKWLGSRRWEDEDPDAVVQRKTLHAEISSRDASTPQESRKRARDAIRDSIRDIYDTEW